MSVMFYMNVIFGIIDSVMYSNTGEASYAILAIFSAACAVYFYTQEKET